MELGGSNIDIVTGTPDFSTRNKVAEKRTERIISEYQNLVNDLAGDGGAVVKRIAGLYATRINDLIKTDPVCLAYQSIFDDCKIKVNVGKVLAKSKLNVLKS